MRSCFMKQKGRCGPTAGEPGGATRAAGGGLGFSEACASPQMRSAALESRAKSWASGLGRLETRAWMSSGAMSLTLPWMSRGGSAVLKPADFFERLPPSSAARESMMAVDSSDLWGAGAQTCGACRRARAGQMFGLGCRLAGAFHKLTCIVSLRFCCAGSPM